MEILPLWKNTSEPADESEDPRRLTDPTPSFWNDRSEIPRFPRPTSPRNPELHLADLAPSGRSPKLGDLPPPYHRDFRRVSSESGCGDRSPTWHLPTAGKMTRVDDVPPPQCRICFDGPDQELGRLIRPCLCKGSISVCLRTDCHQSHAVYPHPLFPLSMSMSSACRNGGPPPLPGTHSGSARSVATATILLGLGCLGWPPIQASSLRTRALNSFLRCPWSSGRGCRLGGHIHAHCLRLFLPHRCLSWRVRARGLRGLVHLLFLLLPN